MSLETLIDELVEERSLEALEKLTGVRNDDVLEALIGAAGRIMGTEEGDSFDDGILEEVRSHVIESRPVGLLVDIASQHGDPDAREFALSCLGEIGDPAAIGPMITLFEDRDPRIREAAAEHLALMTRHDLGKDPAKWREWHRRRQAGLEEQAVEDREDKARLLKLQMRGAPSTDDQAVIDEYESGLS